MKLFRLSGLATAGLANEVAQLAGLAYLEQFGGSEQLAEVVAVSGDSLDAEFQAAVVRALSAWSNRDDSNERSNLQQAITGGADKTVRIFNVANGQLVRQLEGQVGPVTAISLSAK